MLDEAEVGQQQTEAAWDPSLPAPAPGKRARLKRMMTDPFNDARWRRGGASAAIVVGSVLVVGAVVALSFFIFPLPLLLLVPLVFLAV